MQKLLAKLLVFLIIFQIIVPISIIGQVFAVSNTWDFSNSSDYTLSDADTNHIRIENSLVRLPYHLEHLWAISDTSLDWAIRVLVKWNYAFMSAYDADSIISIDISDPTTPIIVNTITNWDGGIDLDGPIWLAFTWNYLYVAWYLSDNINIIDISDPTNMSFIKEIADSRWDQQLNWVKDIQVFWNHLYATAYNDDAFNIFDNSDPTDPQFLEDLKDSSKLDWINRAKIDWTYAYVSVDKNDSFEIIDLTNQDDSWQNVSIVWELNNWDNWALLDWARWLSFSWNLAYIASNISDAMEIIDITDKTNPIHTWSILNWWDVVLDANRQVILYNWFAFNSARTSDAIEVVNILDPNSPFHESNIVATSDILLDWANDIYNSWSIFYVAWNTDNSLEVLRVKYSDSSPYIIPNNAYNYTWAIVSINEVLWSWNEWVITYQISRDAWTTWYWFNWSTWSETSSWVENSNDISTLNSHLYDFNILNKSWTWSFLFKAFLNSNWDQKVELDALNINIVDNPTDILNPVFWYDWQDIDWDWDSSNNPWDWDEVSIFKDKFNWYDAYNTNAWTIPTFDVSSLTWTSINFDWVDDYYEIDNQDDINTWDYYEKSFSMVFKTWDDVNTFQNVYEQGGNARWYVIQIENWHLYAWVFNNIERDDDDQYKFADLWEINENQVYYIMMIQESSNTKTLKVYLDSNLFWDFSNVDYQRAHAWSIWMWFVNWNIVKATDNSTTDWPANFKWQIWEFMSWNYALSDLERQWIDAYIKNKWDLDFKVYPIILSSSINDWILIKNIENYDFYFTYEDWQWWNWIDINSAKLELYKFDLNNWVWWSNVAWSWIVQDSLTTSTGSFHFNLLDMWDYKLRFTIWNVDWNVISKEILFEVDYIWAPEKVFHYDAQNIDWDFDDSNNPSDWSLIWKINDIKNNFDANQTTSDNEAIYNLDWINTHPTVGFDGIDDYYWIDNENAINLDVYYEKSYSMVLKTWNDVDTLQVIYEQWWGYRWYWIQMESGHLFIWAWNNRERDSWEQYKFVDLWEIEPNKTYNILMTQDSTSGVDASDIIKWYINWILAWTLDHVDYQRWHGWDIVLWKNHDWKKYNWDDIWDWYNFKWEIWEYISWNHALTDEEIDSLNDYLKVRWDLDSIAPVVSSTNIASGSILPWGIHNLEFVYSDTSEYGTWVWINISSDNIILERYNSSTSSWEDYSNQIATWTITQTWASYSTMDLDYWKYRIKFSIADNNWNISNVFENTFYIDKPELIISTGSINIGTLNDSNNTFWDDLVVTVKSIWAPFRVKLKKNKELTHSNNSDFIPYYDWSLWMWYDKNNDGNLNDFNDDIILSDSWTLNTNWELNTYTYTSYTYTLKMWAIIDKLQAWWDYTWKIDFEIELDY